MNEDETNGKCLIDNADYLAGALAAENGDLKIQLIARGYLEPSVFNWYSFYDTNSGECRAVLYGNDGCGLEIKPCSSDNKSCFTKAVLTSLDGPTHYHPPLYTNDPSLWYVVFLDGWVDSTFIDLNVLRPIMEKGAVKHGTDFNFDTWAIKGVRRKNIGRLQK